MVRLLYGFGSALAMCFWGCYFYRCLFCLDGGVIVYAGIHYTTFLLSTGAYDFARLNGVLQIEELVGQGEGMGTVRYGYPVGQSVIISYSTLLYSTLSNVVIYQYSKVQTQMTVSPARG